MTVYAPADSIYHSACPPPCPAGGHHGAHKRDKRGILRYTKENSPVIEPVKSVTCVPECEEYLRRVQGWTSEPPLVAKLHSAVDAAIAEANPPSPERQVVLTDPFSGPFGPQVLPMSKGG